MSGWDAGITSFSRSISGISKLAEDVATDLAADIKDDLQKKYAAGKDPYGEAWTPRRKQQPWPIMRRSGALYRSLEASVNGPKIIVLRGRGAEYGAFHQRGTRRGLPVRLIIPINGRGVPDSWNPLFQKRVSARFKKLFK